MRTPIQTEAIDQPGAIRMLHLEDDPADARLVAEALSAGGIPAVLERVEDLEHFQEAVARRSHSLILCDYAIPGLDPLEALRFARATRPQVPFIFVSGGLGEEQAVEALKLGATDYVLKHRLVRLVPSVQRALMEVRDRRLRQEAEERVQELNASLQHRNAELDAERMRWRGVVEGIADEVWVCDPAGRMSLINLPDATAMGLEDFEGRPIDEVLQELEITLPDGTPRDPEESPLLRSVRTGEIVRGEEIMRIRRTGKTRHRQYSCAPMRDAAGRITGAVAIVRDITDHIRTEQALRDADRRKDEFLAMLSHELRNPLTPIVNGLYILDHAVPGGEQDRRVRAMIGRQVNHLTRLVGDLLDVSRITRGKIQLQLERVDLCDLVARTIEDHQTLFLARGIELTSDTRVDDILWTAADATRVGQALGNVLQNAAKFTPRGGRVSVLVAREGPTAVVRVRDTGVGISPDMIGRVFEPFTQADTSLDRTSGGLGLGLALVKGLVELHGGEVAASSAGPGRGSEFSIRLPVEVEPRSHAPPRSELDRCSPRRVLVIEDNAEVAESLKVALETGEHQVAVAFSGPDGVAMAQEFSPDVVLCDLGLPGMDGYAVARAIRADPRLRSAFLVAVSGYAKQEDVDRCRAAGFDQHVAKPPDLAALARALASAGLHGGHGGSTM